MKRIIACAIATVALSVPVASMAHDYVSGKACGSSAGLANDCVRADTDTEFEDGLIVTVDGDDSDPRGDGFSDGYVAVEITKDGATVYCEDQGGFNHIADRDGGDTDDANGENDICEP